MTQKEIDITVQSISTRFNLKMPADDMLKALQEQYGNVDAQKIFDILRAKDNNTTDTCTCTALVPITTTSIATPINDFAGNPQTDSAYNNSEPMSSEEYAASFKGFEQMDDADFDSTAENSVVTCTSTNDTYQVDTQSQNVIETSTNDNVALSSEHYVSDSSEKISLPNIDNLAEYINHLDIMLAAEKYLPRDKSRKGFVCDCGSGSGRKGTGLHFYIDEAGRQRLKCFVCNVNFTVLSLICHFEHLDNHGKDFIKALKIACDIFGISDADSVPAVSNSQPIKDLSDMENFHYSRLDEARAGLQPFFNTQGGIYRAIPYADYSRIQAGYLPDLYFHADNKIHPALIFRNDISGIFGRAVDGANVKENIHKTSTFTVNVPVTDIANSNVFIVEGIYDALSIAFATDWQAYVIASGGTSGLSQLKLTLKKLFPAEKPNFILMLDNDENSQGKNSGQDAAVDFLKELRKEGYCVVNRVLSDEKNLDANSYLIRYGKQALKNLIEKIIADAQIELDDLMKEISAKPIQQNDADVTHKKLTLTAEQRKALFSGEIADLDNARRIACMFKDQLRYLTDSDKWCTYGGQFWTIGSNSRNAPLYPYASKLADVLKANAENTFEKKVARAFRDTRKINSAVNYLKGVREILITRQDLDTHRNLLNCLNGVVDLETKKLYPRDPKLLITQMVNAEYHADFHSDIVNKFLSDIIPDEETRLALLRFLGYCLTGDVTSEKGLFIHGAGGNGKGTLSQTLLKLFNTYATAFPIEALLTKFKSKDANAATPVFSLLESKRIALAEEIPAGEKLDVAKFKLLTGGDSIPIRRLHEEATSIEPTHKMIFSGNHLPELQDTNDNGLIRRLMVIKFTQTFDTANCDTHLKSKLATADALSALLSLLIDNAAQWYKDGLLDSAAMQRDKSEYLQEENFIADFISENCSVVATGTIRFTDFIERLRAESLQARGMSDRALSSAVTRELENIKNVVKRKAHGIYKIWGLVWRDADDSKGFREDEFAGDVVPESKIPF